MLSYTHPRFDWSGAAAVEEGFGGSFLEDDGLGFTITDPNQNPAAQVLPMLSSSASALSAVGKALGGGEPNTISKIGDILQELVGANYAAASAAGVQLPLPPHLKPAAAAAPVPVDPQILAAALEARAAAQQAAAAATAAAARPAAAAMADWLPKLGMLAAGVGLAFLIAKR